MKKLILMTLAAAIAVVGNAQRTFEVNVKPGATIQPTMYGVFFEDINTGADGGLYAELLQNRSFEFYPNHFAGWDVVGNVSIGEYKPAFDRCPHYVTMRPTGHNNKISMLQNNGFYGIGIKKDSVYNFSVYARTNSLESKGARLKIEIVDDNNNVCAKQYVDVKANKWQKYTANISAKKVVKKGSLRVTLEGAESVDLDHISLFPADNWHGLRSDLVKALEDLKPGVFRFPGGCIVEGADLDTRYDWKKSVGPVENRPINENRWQYTYTRMAPNYFQTYGLGFYEFFLLSEKLGAEPLPVLSCGLACQYQNRDEKKLVNAHAHLDELQPFIDDALDLIEFANGDVKTKWGKLRADMGHPAPFNLRQIGIGNEQWGPLYPERLIPFVEQIRKKYPKIKICGTSGPSADGKDFDFGWEKMKEIGVDLVDEHYYRDAEWFLNNAGRYDNYDRQGPKVFAGEYACHIKDLLRRQPGVSANSFGAALAEAAFMTGLERNADVVYQATYAPLFAHVDGWQWRPDLIWFDNLNVVRSANWYVQQLYALNKGTNVISLTENNSAVKGQDGLYASAVFDKPSKTYIVKIANTSEKDEEVTLNFTGVKYIKDAKVTVLHNEMNAVNSIENPENVVPHTFSIKSDGTKTKLTIKAQSFYVLKF